MSQAGEPKRDGARKHAHGRKEARRGGTDRLWNRSRARLSWPQKKLARTNHIGRAAGAGPGGSEHQNHRPRGLPTITPRPPCPKDRDLMNAGCSNRMPLPWPWTNREQW